MRGSNIVALAMTPVLFFAPILFANGDFWSQLSGPGGGKIVSITINDGEQCYIGSDGNGVYDSTDNGQLIKTLLEEKKLAGNHMIKWDASNLPSATYFIRFKTKDFIKVQKCILLK